MTTDNLATPDPTPPFRARVATLLLETGLAVAWSSAFIGAVLASHTLSVFSVLLWRFVIIAVALSPFLISAWRAGLDGRWFLLQAVLGAIGMFACLSFGVKGIDIGVPAGTSALIAALQPLVTAALAGPLLGEKVKALQWVGLAICVADVRAARGRQAACLASPGRNAPEPGGWLPATAAATASSPPRSARSP